MPDLSQLRLLAIDTASIQHYIFNSNRLRENVGASYLVASVTGSWALAAARDTVPGAHNIDINDALLDRRIEGDPNLWIEVIYAGGGNFAALFRDADTAYQFTRTLSKKVLEEAPGLRVFIQHEPYQWGQPLGQAVTDLLQAIKARRNNASHIAPLAGLGVTVMCGSTALPAVRMFKVGTGQDDAPRPVSSEVAAKNGVATPHYGQPSAANIHLRDQLPIDDPYDYPLDFDDLGRTHGDTSFIAVVHADGDGVGKLVQSLAAIPDPRDYIVKMRSFSQTLQAASQTALRGTIDALKQSITCDVEKRSWGVAHTNRDLSIRVELIEKDGKTILPIRPIVFGGDDVTFVCDARIALALTADYLKRFQEETASRKLGGANGLSACAGIAMVKSHYPFARAYALAEELSAVAKQYRHENEIVDGCLHWHFALGGVYGDWDVIQQREYTAKTGNSLTLRPVSLRGNDMRSWTTVEKAVKRFQSADWLERRNKAKALRDALREGEEAEDWFYRQYEITTPERGWQNGVCTQFDALELMDIYIPLRETPDVKDAR